jgi:site-specific DNA recombinase
MKSAVIYARVSSREQEREGFSIQAQQRFLREYAAKNDFRIIDEFIDVETAKESGRKRFGEMLTFVSRKSDRPVILVEKTDRLYRNFHDAVKIEDLGINVHLVKENQILGIDAKSQDRFMHGIHLVMARNYSDNLKEEVKKGMREKAEQGIYPTKPPFGYRNNRIERNIEIHPENSRIAIRIFELFGKGDLSLLQLREKIRSEFGKTFAKSYFAKLLRNPFYSGFFVWQNRSYSGKHPVFIDSGLFQRVQQILSSSGKPGKYRKHSFAFSGMLNCEYDGSAVTAGLQKSKYIYYRCTEHKGKCELPYMREEKVSSLLAGILQNIYVPETIASQIVENLRNSQNRIDESVNQQRQNLSQRISTVRNRIDQLYIDKLDGKIEEEFWTRKSTEWQEEERQLKSALLNLGSGSSKEIALTAERTFELANKAYSLYLSQPVEEQAKLLKMVLLNCSTDGVSVSPTYRKPFDLIFKRAVSKDWSGREDLNLRPPGPEPGALPG